MSSERQTRRREQAYRNTGPQKTARQNEKEIQDCKQNDGQTERETGGQTQKDKTTNRKPE